MPNPSNQPKKKKSLFAQRLLNNKKLEASDSGFPAVEKVNSDQLPPVPKIFEAVAAAPKKSDDASLKEKLSKVGILDDPALNEENVKKIM